ncbi:hypothetical protein G6F65_023102 [Rhizopus arrhizus]|nr:hypothetical protein G6F65_023102 [Rhizopus arrhizus]
MVRGPAGVERLGVLAGFDVVEGGAHDVVAVGGRRVGMAVFDRGRLQQVVATAFRLLRKRALAGQPFHAHAQQQLIYVHQRREHL